MASEVPGVAVGFNFKGMRLGERVPGSPRRGTAVTQWSGEMPHLSYLGMRSVCGGTSRVAKGTIGWGVTALPDRGLSERSAR